MNPVHLGMIELLKFMFLVCLFGAITYVFLYLPVLKIYDNRLLRKAWLAQKRQAFKHLLFLMGPCGPFRIRK